MHMLNKRWYIRLISAVLFVFTILGFVGVILGNRGFIDRLWAKETIDMLIELAIVFGIIFFILSLPKKRIYKISYLTIAMMFFLWLHSTLLPMLAAFLYAVGLILVGEAALIPVRRQNQLLHADPVFRLAHDFLVGSAIYILLICGLSVLQEGSMTIIRICTICLFGISVLLLILFRRQLQGQFFAPGEDALFEKKHGHAFHFLIAYGMTMLLLQAGRLNITLDYDSLRYGLRSRSILNNGLGIYENLGFVNDIYFYPKGLEILTMPLNFDISYGFILAFTMVILVGCLCLVFRIVQICANRFWAVVCIVVITSIPGVMNMGVSAKTDIITLFVQLIFVGDILAHLRKEEGLQEVLQNPADTENRLLWALAAVFISLTLKPTSIFFFGGVGIFTLIYLLTTKRFTIRAGAWQWMSVAVCGLAAVMVTARTLMLTGYPITSVFARAFRQIGFHGKYPYHISAVPSMPQDLEGIGVGERYLLRLFSIFVAPVGDDMRHVLMAMPTAFLGGIMWILILTLPPLCFFLYRKKQEDRIWFGYITGVFFTVLALSLYALGHLYQVDGNYFMLLYIMAAIAAAVISKRMLSSEEDKSVRKTAQAMTERGSGKRLLFTAFLPACLSSVILTSITNWAGAYGFTPRVMPSMLGTENSFGFYNHRQERIQEVEDRLIVEIYNRLTPRDRLLAMDFLPAAYLFPCSVQSYTDLAGSGGNPYLVKKLEIFKDYLEYAQMDYIFTDIQFLWEHPRAEEIIRFMLEDGSLVPVVDRNDNMLYQYITREELAAK